MQYGTPLLLSLYSSVWSTVGTAVCHDFTAVVIGQRIVVLRTYGNVIEFFTEKITVTWLFYQLASRSASRQYVGSPSDSSLLEQSLAACGKIAMSFPLKIWTHTWFLGSTWVYAVYGISITSAIFAELTVCGCVYMSVMLEICKRPVWFGLVSVWSVTASHTCCKRRSTFSRASTCRHCWSCLPLIPSSTLGSHCSLLGT